ncbi:MAG: S24/S26 family peptidase [Prevotella sp.]|nr:S24/S26 family peptidase [Prevotella sp.]MBQ8701221.1 S24/S26 family peptidase [Prevotella sp.]MBQ9651901.1 S24/S26 family peptidase [Prevotella sp.]
MPSDYKSLSVEEKFFDNALLLPEVVKLLNEGHTVTLRLRGFSMRPFLEDKRDKALLKKAENPKVGDAVLAEIAPGHFVLHRIISIEGEKVVLRGDGNLGTEQCTLKDVKGLAIGFYRKGREVADMTTDKKWRVYSAVWTRLFPIRRYLLAIHRRIILRFF